MAKFLTENWLYAEWQFTNPSPDLAGEGYSSIQAEEGAISSDYVLSNGVTEIPTVSFIDADKFAKTTGNDVNWKTTVDAKLTAQESAANGLYYTAKLNDSLSIGTSKKGNKTLQSIKASHSVTYTPKGTLTGNAQDLANISGLTSMTLGNNDTAMLIWRGPDDESWSLSQEAYIDSDDYFNQKFSYKETDKAIGDIKVNGSAQIGCINGYKNITVGSIDGFSIGAFEGGNEVETNEETYSASFTEKGSSASSFKEKITRNIKEEETSDGKIVVGSEKAGATGNIGNENCLDYSEVSTSELGIHNYATISLFGKALHEEIEVGTENYLSKIDGGNETESFTAVWDRGEEQKADEKKHVLTITDTLKSTSTEIHENISAGDFNTKFADIDCNVYNFKNVNLNVMTDAESFYGGNYSRKYSSALSATAAYNHYYDSSKETVDVTFSDAWELVTSTKAAGAFKANGDLEKAQNRLITANDIRGYATVALKNVNLGNSAEEEWSTVDGVIDTATSSTRKLDCKLSEVWDSNGHEYSVAKFTDSSKDSRSQKSTSVFTLYNIPEAKDQGFGVAGNIINFKSVTITNAVIDGDVTSEQNIEESNVEDITYVGGTKSKGESFTESGKWTYSSSNAADVTLDNVEVRYIDGYDKVKLNNCATSTICRSYAWTETSTWNTTTDNNGLANITSTFTSATKTGGTFTALKSGTQSIQNYATVTLTDTYVDGNISQYADESISYKSSIARQNWSVAFEYRNSYLIDPNEAESLSTTLGIDYVENIDYEYDPLNEFDFSELDNVDAFNKVTSVPDQCIMSFSDSILEKESYNISQSWTVTGSVTMKDATCDGSISGYKSIQLVDSYVLGDIHLGSLWTEYEQFDVTNGSRLHGDFTASYSSLTDSLTEEFYLKKSWKSTGDLKMKDSYVDGSIYYLQKVTVSGESGIGNYYGSYGDDTFALEKGTEFYADVMSFDKGNDTLKIGDNCSVEISAVDFGSGSDSMSIGANSEVTIDDFNYGTLASLTIGKGSTLYVSNVAFENMQNMRQYRSYCESGAIAATM